MKDIRVGSKHETRRTTTMGKTKIMMKQVSKKFTQKEDRTWEACRRKRQTKRLDYYMTHQIEVSKKEKKEEYTVLCETSSQFQIAATYSTVFGHVYSQNMYQTFCD